MVTSCSITNIFIFVLLSSVGILGSTVAARPRELRRSSPVLSGSPKTVVPEVVSSSLEEFENGSLSDVQTITSRLQRYDEVMGEYTMHFLLADSVNKSNSPEESYFDMNILSALVERNENGDDAGRSSVWNHAYGRMNHTLGMLADMDAQLQYFAGPVKKQKVCSGTISDEEFENYIDSFYDAYNESFTAIVNRLAVDGGLNIQRNMLKCLSMSMLNNEGVNRLLKVLTAEHVRATEKRNLVLSKRGFYDMVQRVDMDVGAFEEWVSARRIMFNMYGKHINRVAMLFTSVAPKDLVLEHFRQSELCAAKWYQIYRDIRSMLEFIVDAKCISSKLLYSINGRDHSPSAFRLYGKTLKIELDSLPYRVGDHEVKDRMMKNIEDLVTCVKKLEYNATNDKLDTKVKQQIGDVVERAMGINIGDDPELLFALGYLFRLFTNVSVANYEMQKWIRALEKVRPTGSSSAASLYALAIYRAKSVTKVLNGQVDRAKMIFGGINGRCFKNIGIGQETEGEGSRDVDITQLRDIMDQTYMKLYSARLLLMEFYDSIFHMRKFISIQIRLFQEYDIVDEARTIVNMALVALEEHFAHFMMFKKRAMSYLEMHPPMKGSSEDVTGSASNLMKQEGKVKREDIELIVHQLNWPNNIVSLVRELDSIFNALHSGSPLNDVEEALALFFGMRTMLHKALLLEKSIDVIKHLGSRIVEGMNGHGETGKR
ncbi:hypothetical protein BgAZ_101290 [Babesia gibsoni]|uniref:Uncharacterized protein n=1 Tax=Babesia gibsoni TaxID=33632 RepID=A0AAD8UUT7_BABGI|nr:hypothetical protein BgAZ_101280 [Babesia gibsoni]KAK1444223.1 hypothetical protein BgAZ_101290 [Babesia gibsoni]